MHLSPISPERVMPGNARMVSFGNLPLKRCPMIFSAFRGSRLAFLIALLANVCAAQTQLSPRYSVDGTVNAIVTKGDTLIMGGTFGYIGLFTGAGAIVTTTSDESNPAFPKIFGSISASTPDGAGGFYISGVFAKEFNGATFERIEHILPDYSFDTGFSVTVSSLFGVKKLLYSNGLLFIGGQYIDHINGQPAGNLAAIDVATEQLVPWIPSVNIRYLGGVFGLYISLNTLYITGSFDSVGGVARSNIAAIQIGTGTVKPWNFAAHWPGAAHGFSDIEFFNDSMVVSGGFDEGGGPSGSRHASAVTDTVTGSALNYLFTSAGLFGAGPNALYFAANVNSTAISGDTLFAFSGGTFDTRITALKLNGGSPQRLWARYFNMIAGPVEMKVKDGALFVAGNNFIDIYVVDSTNDNPANIERKIDGAVKLNTANGSLYNWYPAPRPVGAVTTMQMAGNNILLGGSFQYLKALERPHIVMINTVTDSVLPFHSKLGYASINAMALKDSVLYAAGDALTFGGVINSKTVLAYNISTGDTTSWHVPYLGTAHSIEVNSQYVFVGGQLAEPAGGAGRTNLFAINRSDGQLISWAPNPNFAVRALHLHRGYLFAGGDFTIVGSNARARLASFDTVTLALSPWNPGTDGPVYALTSDNHIVWVGGSLTTIGDSSCNLFAGVDYLSGGVQRIPAASMWGAVYAFRKLGCHLMTGGAFQINNTSCNSLLAYNMVDRAVVPSATFCLNTDNMYGGIKALGSIGRDVYQGGFFTKTNNSARATNIERTRFPISALAGCADYRTVQAGAWNNPATWLGGQVPPDDAKVLVRHTVTVTQNASCFSLLLVQAGNIVTNPGVTLTVLN